MPLVFSRLVRITGWVSAVKLSGVSCLAWAAVTVPFYLIDPQGFTPSQTVHELGQFGSVMPGAGTIIPLAALLLAVLLAFLQRRGSDNNLLLWNSAAVLAFPVLCGMALSSLKSGKIDFSFAYFGTFFLFFGTAAFGPSLLEHDVRCKGETR
jgi:hypothetical protein